MRYSERPLSLYLMSEHDISQHMSWSGNRLIRLHGSERIYTNCSSMHIDCPNYIHIFLLIFTSEYQYPAPYLYVGMSTSLFTSDCPTPNSSLRRNVRLLSITCKCPTPYLYVGISDYTFLSIMTSYDTSRSTISHNLNVLNLTSACDNLSLSNPLTL